MKKILLTILLPLVILPLSSFNVLKDVDINSMNEDEMISYLKENTNFIEEVVVTADKHEDRHNKFLKDHKNFMFGKDTIYPIKPDSIRNDTVNIDSLKHRKRHHKDFNDEYSNNYVRFNLFTIGWYQPYIWNDFWFYYDPFYSDFTPFNYWNYPHYYGWSYPFYYWNYPYYWNNYYYGYYGWNNDYYGHRWGNNHYSYASGNMKNMSFGPKHRPIGQNFYGRRINNDHFVTRPNRIGNMNKERLNTEVVKRHPRMDGQMTRIRPNGDINKPNRNYPMIERTRNNMYNNSYHRRINNGEISRQRGNMNERNNYVEKQNVEKQRNDRSTYRYDRQRQDTYNRPHTRMNNGYNNDRNRNQNDNVNRGNSGNSYERRDNSTRSSGNMNSGNSHHGSNGNSGGERRR